MESLYLQDEWKLLSSLTLNYGLRFDHYQAYLQRQPAQPAREYRLAACTGTTVHAGYSRYFTPPPFELVGSETISKFAGTSAAPAVTTDTAPQSPSAPTTTTWGCSRSCSQRADAGRRQLLPALAEPDR